LREGWKGDRFRGEGGKRAWKKGGEGGWGRKGRRVMAAGKDRRRVPGAKFRKSFTSGQAYTGGGGKERKKKKFSDALWGKDGGRKTLLSFARNPSCINLLIALTCRINKLPDVCARSKELTTDGGRDLDRRVAEGPRVARLVCRVKITGGGCC